MSQVIEVVAEFVTEQEWPNQRMDEYLLRGGVRGNSGHWQWTARSRKDDDLLLFHAVCPMKVPRKRRAAAMEYITRANSHLLVGNFEMDLSDGEVMYKTSVPVDAEQGLSRKVLEHVVYANFATMDRYLPGLMAVIWGKSTPWRAIQKAESDLSQHAQDEEAEEDEAVPASRWFQQTPSEN